MKINEPDKPSHSNIVSSYFYAEKGSRSASELCAKANF